mgnify:CR=1 FL=1
MLLLKGPHTDLLADGLIFSELSAGVATKKAPETYGEKLNYEVYDSLFKNRYAFRVKDGRATARQKCWQKPLFLC